MPTRNGKIATCNSGNVENAHWKHLEGALGWIEMVFFFLGKRGHQGMLRAPDMMFRRHHQCI